MRGWIIDYLALSAGVTSRLSPWPSTLWSERLHRVSSSQTLNQIWAKSNNQRWVIDDLAHFGRPILSGHINFRTVLRSALAELYQSEVTVRGSGIMRHTLTLTYSSLQVSASRSCCTWLFAAMQQCSSLQSTCVLLCSTVSSPSSTPQLGRSLVFVARSILRMLLPVSTGFERPSASSSNWRSSCTELSTALHCRGYVGIVRSWCSSGCWSLFSGSVAVAEPLY